MTSDHSMSAEELWLRAMNPRRSELITIEEVATVFDVSVRTVRRWQAAGKMPRRYCRSRRESYLRTDIEALKKEEGAR